MRAADMATILAAQDDAILPITPDALLQGRAVLVLAPHPDDESLGCEALLAHAFARPTANFRAHVVCLTDGAASHPGSEAVSPSRLAAIRRLELRAAIIRLGGCCQRCDVDRCPGCRSGRDARNCCRGDPNCADLQRGAVDRPLAA